MAVERRFEAAYKGSWVVEVEGMPDDISNQNMFFDGKPSRHCFVSEVGFHYKNPAEVAAVTKCVFGKSPALMTEEEAKRVMGTIFSSFYTHHKLTVMRYEVGTTSCKGEICVYNPDDRIKTVKENANG